MSEHKNDAKQGEPDLHTTDFNDDLSDEALDRERATRLCVGCVGCGLCK